MFRRTRADIALLGVHALVLWCFGVHVLILSRVSVHVSILSRFSVHVSPQLVPHLRLDDRADREKLGRAHPHQHGLLNGVHARAWHHGIRHLHGVLSRSVLNAIHSEHIYDVHQRYTRDRNNLYISRVKHRVAKHCIRHTLV